MTRTYQFTEKVWLYPGKAGWYFITLPLKVAEEINYFFSLVKRGWGSLPVNVTIGQTAWQTSIFPDKKSHSFLLPVKALVRQKERIKKDDHVVVNLELGD